MQRLSFLGAAPGSDIIYWGKIEILVRDLRFPEDPLTRPARSRQPGCLPNLGLQKAHTTLFSCLHFLAKSRQSTVYINHSTVVYFSSRTIYLLHYSHSTVTLTRAIQTLLNEACAGDGQKSAAHKIERKLMCFFPVPLLPPNRPHLQLTHGRLKHGGPQFDWSIYGEELLQFFGKLPPICRACDSKSALRGRPRTLCCNP